LEKIFKFGRTKFTCLKFSGLMDDWNTLSNQPPEQPTSASTQFHLTFQF
jgi:hypothetical protein